MKYSNSVLFAKGQQSSTDNYNDFGYFNDGTVWYETPPTYTARVTAYAAATGITDYTILDPLNEFDKGLVYWGLDTIMKAVYPMMTDKTSQSDMATQMKYNFMNPLDTNPAFRLNWVGGWVYSRTGALPNGTNAYADTFLVPSTTLTNNSTHMLYYSRTQSNPSAATFDMGTSNGTPGAIFSLSIQLSNILYADSYNSTTNRITASNTTSLGGFMNSRTSSTSFKTFKNGVQLGTTSTAASSGFASLGGRIYVGCLNNSNAGSPSFYSNKECAFASIGNGLTDFQADIFSTLVNNLQKALNRAVY